MKFSAGVDAPQVQTADKAKEGYLIMEIASYEARIV